jgi:hypothetical protein
MHLGGTAMTNATQTQPPPRSIPRSVLAVFLGLLAVFILSLGTDQILHMLEVYPPWGQPMRETSLNLLALSYRLVYGVIGGTITALFAPRKPMGHALILGGIGTVLSLLGAIGALSVDIGPVWYPIALVLTALPCAWLGGVLHGRMRNM